MDLLSFHGRLEFFFFLSFLLLLFFFPSPRGSGHRLRNAAHPSQAELALANMQEMMDVSLRLHGPSGMQVDLLVEMG